MTSLLLAASLLGTPTIALPAEVNASPGRLVKLTATTEGKLVRWVLASDDADLVPFPDGKTALFCSPKPGRYVVFAWTAAGDVPSEAAKCVVVVGEPHYSSKRSPLSMRSKNCPIPPLSSNRCLRNAKSEFVSLFAY